MLNASANRFMEARIIRVHFAALQQNAVKSGLL